MITLWDELKKIASLLRGSASANIFGYKSTLANQMYLFYCLSGKIYYTDQVHHQLKYLWYGVAVCQTIISLSVGVIYLWYMYNVRFDLMMFYDVVISVGSCFSITVGFPLFCRLYDDRIEKMIEHVDVILTTSRRSFPNFDPSIGSLEQDKITNDARRIVIYFMGLFFFFFGLYLSICFSDVVLFYEEQKAKNYLYYAIPPPLIQEYGGFHTYLVFNVVLSGSFLIIAFQLWLVIAIVLCWNMVCCDELDAISENLQQEINSNLTEQFCGSIEDWNGVFESSLERCTVRVQHVNLLIDYLREFTEINATFITWIGFVYAVACLHVCLMDELSLVLKMKFLTGFCSTDMAVFSFYWIGQNFNDSFHRVSHAVYSTPWYESVKIRKNLYILLCQMQLTKDLVIFKVYKLVLNTFLQYLRGVYSYANILRTLTN